MRIYTKTGDDGTTGLLFGSRTSKGGPVSEASGAVDEAVSDLGVVRAEVGSTSPELAAELLQIQRDLFVLGADLATNPKERGKLKPEVSLVVGSMIERLEAWIDRTVAEHPLPEEFVVPGTNRVEALLDVARTTVRRAERRAVRLSERTGHEVNPEAIRYLNRLSDLLFVYGRWQAGAPEPPTRPRASEAASPEAG